MASMLDSGEQRPITVLHVDDDATIARSLASALRRAGYEVISALTAEAAIAELGAHTFDVIVSDFNLGEGGTGAEVLTAAGSVPLIFLCADERAAGYGVPWLEKPCSPAMVRAAIEGLLEDAPKVVREMPLDYTGSVP